MNMDWLRRWVLLEMIPGALTDVGWVLVHSVWLAGLIGVFGALFMLLPHGASSRRKHVVLMLSLLAIPVASVAWHVCGANQAVRIAMQSLVPSWGDGGRLQVGVEIASQAARRDAAREDAAREDAENRKQRTGKQRTGKQGNEADMARPSGADSDRADSGMSGVALLGADSSNNADGGDSGGAHRLDRRARSIGGARLDGGLRTQDARTQDAIAPTVHASDTYARNSYAQHSIAQHSSTPTANSNVERVAGVWSVLRHGTIVAKSAWRSGAQVVIERLLVPCLPGIAIGWLVGVGLISLRRLADFRFIQNQLLSHSRIISTETRDVVDETRKRVGLERVMIRESANAVVPMTFHWRRPVVLLPVGIPSHLTSSELEAILLHELIHVRRRDYLSNCLQVAVETLMFYHPAVGWLSKQIRCERENACDDAVLPLVSSRKVYARALTAVAAHSKEKTLSVNLAADGGFLRRRVRRILGLPSEPEARCAPLLRIGAVTFTCVLLLVSLSTPPNEFAGRRRVKASGIKNHQATGRTSIAPAKVAHPATGQTETAQTATAQTETAQTATGHSSVEHAAHETIVRNDTVHTNPAHAHFDDVDPIGGTILGPTGKPLADAHVYLRVRPSSYRYTKVELGTVTTKQDGRFRFENLRVPTDETPYRSIALDVIAVKPGYCIRWQKLNRSTTNIKLKLRRQATFKGRVVDDVGRAIPRVMVSVSHIMSLNTISKIDFANGHTPSPNGASFLDISTSEIPMSASTNAKGEFELEQLPKRVGLVLDIDDPRCVKRRFYAATTDEPLPPIRLASKITKEPLDVEGIMSRGRSFHTEQILRAGDNLEVIRGRQLRLRVLRPDGSPVAGATVRTNISEVKPSTTDETGLAHVFQIPRVATSRFSIRLPNQSDVLDTTATFPLSDFGASDTEEIRLGWAAIISGRVDDATTEQGVAGVHLSFRREINGVTSEQVGITDDGGEFRLRVPDNVTGQVCVSRAPPGYDFSKQGAAGTSVSVSVSDPVDDLRFTIEPVQPKLLRFADEEGNSVAVTGDVRVYFGVSAYVEKRLDSDASGLINIAEIVTSQRPISVVQVIARDPKSDRSAYFRTRQVEALSQEPTTITLQANASLTGRVLDSETRQPIANSTIRLGVNYTPTRGQNVGTTTTDDQGRFHFDNLVPMMTYSLGAAADHHVALNSIHTQVQTQPGKTRLVELELEPNIPASVSELVPVSVQVPQQQSATQQLQFLFHSFEKAREEYQTLLDGTQSQAERRQIVLLREPTPAYVDAVNELIAANRGADVELEALIWVLQRSEISGASRSIRADRAKAAARVLANYADRSEIAKVVSNIIYASPDPYSTAMELRKSSHRDVRGRAIFVAAGLVSNQLRKHPRGDTDILRNHAVELYQTVIEDYADIEDWRYETLGNHAAVKTFRLQRIKIGEPAPEIQANDLQGREMALSEFNGKVVVLHHWYADIHSLPDIKEALDHFDSEDVVVLGVNMNDNIEDAVAASKDLAIRSWHDPDETIHSRWSSSVPRTFVIDRDGNFVYIGQRESHRPLLDVIGDAVRGDIVRGDAVRGDAEH